MATYAHQPVATGMHAKLIREARELSPYVVGARYGAPNHVNVYLDDGSLFIIWHGHRDLMPAQYRHARDPWVALTRPASD